MDLVSRLDGYLNDQIMHSNPIPVLPPPKTIKDKKDTTLFDMALKALLKQRMYGNLQNFQTQNVDNKNHLRRRGSSIIEKRKLSQSSDQVNIQKNHSIYKSSKKDSFLETKKDEINFQQKKSQKKQMTQISSSLDLYLKKTNQRKFRLISQKKVRFADESLTKNIKNIQNQYNDTNFISSIEFLVTQKTINLSQKQIQKEFKLPQISDKRRMKSLKMQNVKTSKALFRQNVLKISVKQEFWSFICDKKDQRIRRKKQPTMLRNQSYNTLLQESINFSTGKNLALIQNSAYTEDIVSKKQIYKYNQNLVFKKENFLSFIGNEKLTIPSFVSSLFSFFQLSNLFMDKVTKGQFESILTQLYNQSDRAWCFAIFYFLDTNMNTKIDSSDLFKVYNIIDSSKNIVQTSLDSLKIDCIRQNVQNVNKPVMKKQKTKRQKTMTSQNGPSSQRSTQKKGTKVSIEFSTKKNLFDSEQNFQPQTILLRNNLENIIQLQKQIQNLNQKILLQNSSLLNQKQLSENPQSSSSYKNISGYEKLYLEQGLLEKKDVKISQLGSILQQVSQRNKMKKKKVLDIDHKRLNVKLSSGYVQTFIAMNHNEETRINREFLQNLKDKVKKMSQIKNTNDSKDRGNSMSGIQYAQFYQQKLYLPFKNLFFKLLHIMIQNN